MCYYDTLPSGICKIPEDGGASARFGNIYGAFNDSKKGWFAKMKHRTHGKKRLLWILAGIVLIYCAILLISYSIDQSLVGNDDNESYGDLTGRFSAKYSVEYNGRIYEYRDKQLVNILLLGIDTRSGAAHTEERYGNQADFVLLLSIDKQNKTIKPIHIDRDTMTDVSIYGPFGDPAGSRVMQICLAQAYGSDTSAGSLNTEKSVSDLFAGIPIDYYVAMDLDGISAFNDALSGVTVTLEDDFSHLDPEMVKGATIRLQGKQAEIFVRNRRDVSDGTNAMRMRRQRLYMDSALPILLERMSSDLDFVGNLYDSLGEELTTDMERGFLINEAYKYSQYACEDILTLAGAHSVGADGFVEFYPDRQALNAIIVNTFFE